MTKLRPGLGSCTPNWGTHDDRAVRDCLLRLDLCVSLRHTSDPATLGLAPRPVTEAPNIEPEGVRPRLHQHGLGNEQQDCCGPTTECRLTEAGAAAAGPHQKRTRVSIPAAPAGLPAVTLRRPSSSFCVTGSSARRGF